MRYIKLSMIRKDLDLITFDCINMIMRNLKKAGKFTIYNL